MPCLKTALKPYLCGRKSWDRRLAANPYLLAGFDMMISKPGGLTTGTKKQVIG